MSGSTRGHYVVPDLIVREQPFFGPVVNGVEDAEKAQGIKVDIKYGNEGMTRMKSNIETAIAGGSDGLAVTIPDDNALKDVLCEATKKDIPVISFNIDDSRHGAPSDARLTEGQY